MYVTEQHREAEAHLESARSLTSDVLERLDLQSLRFKDDGLLELQYRASVLGDAEMHEIHTIRRRIGAEILTSGLTLAASQYDRKSRKTGHSKHQPSSTSHSLSHPGAQRNEGNLRRCRIYGFDVATV
ncbi:uncharacterized protein JCM10292_005804 [Rhodotorula paludigena]|uniref:uncharacterized protein n=1 Tax=Rhodotorula paludigena TaxID=86838 RepID=UPI003176039F